MRPPVALLVCLCVVLAGCGAGGSGFGGGDGDGARTVNPALAGTPTASPTPTAVPSAPEPPGVGRSTVDARSLAAAHSAALANRSLTVRIDSRRVSASGTTLLNSTQLSYAAGERQLYRSVVTETPYRRAGALTFNVSSWRNGTVAVRRQEYENGTARYGIVDPGDHEGRPLDFDPTGARVVADLLGQYNLTYGGVVERDGERLHLITEATADQRYQPLRSNVSVRALVTDEGVVRSIAVRYRSTEYGAPATVTVRFALSNVSNTTVPRPAWVDRALAGAENATAATTPLPRASASRWR